MNDEWYTPARYLDAARAVLGPIDLDPASCATANQFVQARRFYTAADDGLEQEWQAGSVFLNPPYSRGNMRQWIGKLIGHYPGDVQAAILLCNACTSEQWFKPLWNYPICFPNHRIRFLGADGQPGPSPRYSNAFVYFGPETALFVETFAQFGAVVGRFRPALRQWPQQAALPLAI